MNFDFSNPRDLVLGIAVFGLVVGIWICLLLAWAMRRKSHDKKLEVRLGAAGPTSGPERELRLWHEGREATTLVPGQRRRAGLYARLEKRRQEADYQLPLSALFLGVAGVCLLIFVLTFLITNSMVAGLGIAALGVFGFWAYTQMRISRRLGLFELQLVDALELASRSLRAGHPLIGAFRLIAEEIPDPLSRVFAEIGQQQSLGVSLEDALREAANATHSADLRLFATSIIIQLKTGGNLADMMDRLAFVIRDRIRLSRRVRILTAQTQFSKRILIGLPFLLLLVLTLVKRQHMYPLYYTSAGHMLLIIAGAGITLGWWTMNRLAKLRV